MALLVSFGAHMPLIMWGIIRVTCMKPRHQVLRAPSGAITKANYRRTRGFSAASCQLSRENAGPTVAAAVRRPVPTAFSPPMISLPAVFSLLAAPSFPPGSFYPQSAHSPQLLPLLPPPPFIPSLLLSQFSPIIVPPFLAVSLLPQFPFCHSSSFPIAFPSPHGTDCLRYA